MHPDKKMHYYNCHNRVLFGDVVTIAGSDGLRKGSVRVVRDGRYDSAALVEWDDGRVENLYVGQLTFVSRDPAKTVAQTATSAEVKSEVQSSGVCTCPKEVWMNSGCKCGAITPYQLKL